MPKTVMRLFVAAFLASAAITALSQTMYKYRGPDGEWIYTDKAPPSEVEREVRDLPIGATPPQVTVTPRLSVSDVELVARNEFHAPVEIQIAFNRLVNLSFPDAEDDLRFVAPARSTTVLLTLSAVDPTAGSDVEFQTTWIVGDPAAQHRPTGPYRAPYAIASSYQITQTFPIGITHLTPDSYYAVDFAMPIGTNVYAARGGTVFEVTSTNFRSGTDPDRDLMAANIVRILHDDGTYAVYAHLNWNSIRVQPGDSVERGQYIADSGNTGFSTGPHLHFVVMRNRGMEATSLPINFAGADNIEVTPETGNTLIAY